MTPTMRKGGARAMREAHGSETRESGAAEGAVLDVEGLRTIFAGEDGELVAVDGVSFAVGSSETVGVVGESGCGKSVLAQSIMRLHDERVTRYEGEVRFGGVGVLSLDGESMRRLRGDDVAMVFQDPMNALNPLKRIGDQIVESLRLHGNLSRAEARIRSVELLRQTGIPMPERRAREYPHQLSGGMRQRVVIAIALACDPRLLIADEPTTALDVTIQAQVLDLLRRLQRDHGMAMLFITHDLGVVSEMCDRVVVMYLGQVVELADKDELFARPLHPYTRGLIAAVPELSDTPPGRLNTIPGTVPPLSAVPAGCRFAARCPFVVDKCRAEAPPLWNEELGRDVRCWRAADIAAGDIGTGAGAAVAGPARYAGSGPSDEEEA